MSKNYQTNLTSRFDAETKYVVYSMSLRKVSSPPQWLILGGQGSVTIFDQYFLLKGLKMGSYGE